MLPSWMASVPTPSYPILAAVYWFYLFLAAIQTANSSQLRRSQTTDRPPSRSDWEQWNVQWNPRLPSDDTGHSSNPVQPSPAFSNLRCFPQTTDMLFMGSNADCFPSLPMNLFKKYDYRLSIFTIELLLLWADVST